jgi:CBS domain-containing protein
MDPELKEIYDFIGATPPFDQLPAEILKRLVSKMTIRYLRSGTRLSTQDGANEKVYLIRKGTLSLLSVDSQLVEKLGESDLYSNLFSQSEMTIQVTEDTLLYILPTEMIRELMDGYPAVNSFFSKSAAQRLNQTIKEKSKEAIINSTLMNSSIAELFNEPATCIESSQSISDAAKMMSELDHSALLIMAGSKLVGIITDKDLRHRCLAKGLSPTAPVSTIMTREPQCVTINHNAFDTLMLMHQRGFRHLPVIRNGAVAGMITVSDLMRQESQNSSHLSGLIHKAKTIEELIDASQLLPSVQVKLTRLGASAEHLGKLVSAITTAITCRLIQFAEKNLGPPPVPYLWVAAGSHARYEQSSHSDQDNALIISEQMKPEDDAWFKSLATFVCDGLAACGYIYCPGNVMATNPKWRQPVSVWKNYFNHWIDTPEPKALMYSSIFFDLFAIHGEANFLKEIRSNLLDKTKRSTLFLALLSRNALKLSPPLGFFRNFVLISDGEYKDTLDLKHNGIAPIVDLARIYALSEGIYSVNTINRLRAAAGTPSLSKEASEELVDALEFLGTLRIEHQANQIKCHQNPDNHLHPSSLSKLERAHLKDAFKVIRSMQKVIQSRYS